MGVVRVRLPPELFELCQQVGAAGELGNEESLDRAEIGEVEVGFAATCVVPPGVGARSRCAGRIVGVIMAVAVRAGAAAR